MQQRIAAQAAVRRSAAPGIILCIPYDLDTHRVLFDIPYSGPEMLFVQGAREKASLPQATAESVVPVDVLGIAQVHWFHDRREGIGLPWHVHEMNVVRHQAVRECRQRMFGCVFQQELEISLTITVAEKDILAAVATLGDVMRNSGHDNSGYSRHNNIR